MDPPSHLFYQTRQPRPFLDRAEGIYLWDTTGKRYLDGSSGAIISNLGHSNRAVLAKMKAQMDRATFGYRLHFRTEISERLADKLASLMPPGLDRIFFVSSGSEAVETAEKLARQFVWASGQENRWKIIARAPAYHGATLGALALTGGRKFAEPFAPLFQEMPHIPAPTCYLDRDSLSTEERGLRYAEMLRERIEEEGPETVLAFIMEPVGGASTGALVAPDSYYRRIREICDEYGVLLIYDEVMSGAGRTGRFLACEHWEAVPDLIIMSKGLGAGYAPLGAVAARTDLVGTVLDSGGFLHGFTSAGNPLSCAAGLAVIEEMEEHDIIGNAAVMGALLKKRLSALRERFPFIGDVRGKGLLLAFEMVSDPELLTPLPKEWNAFTELVEIAYERGLILYARRTRGGTEGDHFLVCPPLIITAVQMEELLALLTESLEIFASRHGLPVFHDAAAG